MIELYVPNPHKMTIPQEKAQCVSWFIETKLDVRPNETTEVSMKETHHHVLQFVYCTRNLWRQGSVRYKEEWATKNI